ncbi:hypothetical protein DSL72_001825 [Monilinia vaccinii-corymbosi]|uniref:Uncharacterized protein n=1 Tax=Monilinia vaccinii-corymbosi TaxID=61207 RepID=A0A8A3PAX3_9HELO|nr:hypothetical protein DSL72_001825 [Monilinia vaccinii-corymbosi]
MPINQHPHRGQKAQNKDNNRILKGSFSYITSYLKRCKQNQPSRSDQPTELQHVIIPTAAKGNSETGATQSFVEDFPEIEEEHTRPMEFLISALKPKAPCRNALHMQTKPTPSFSRSEKPEAETYPRASQTTDSSSSSSSSKASKVGECELYSSATSISISEKQKRNKQDVFMKSLIRRLVTERREENMRLRSSRRIRCLRAVKGVMGRGWGRKLQTSVKFQPRGRKRKLEDDGTE